MCAVLHNLYKYVPRKNCEITYHLPGQGYLCNKKLYHQTLLGGDQLTVNWCRWGTHCNEDVTEERFDGYIPVIEDWHARLTLNRVSMI